MAMKKPSQAPPILPDSFSSVSLGKLAKIETALPPPRRTMEGPSTLHLFTDANFKGIWTNTTRILDGFKHRAPLLLK